MGDVSKFFEKGAKVVSDYGSKISDIANTYNSFAHGSKGLGQASKDFWDEQSQKSDLRGAQLESVVSGLPIVGDFLRGVEGATKLEDLYNNTGKVPAYPASQNLGASSLGYGAAAVARIAEGSNDLYEYYSGSPDGFRSLMNGMYG